jgi:membrane protease YdiL (CAAX protease family)
MNFSGLIKRHPLASFFGLVFGGFWGLGVVLYAYLQARGAPVDITQAGPVALLILFVADAFASAAGIVVTLVVGGKEGVKELFGRLNPRRAGGNWYAAAILTNPIVVTLVLVTLAATISPDFFPPIFKDPTLAVALPFALFSGLMAGTLEEFGWTGFALPRLLARYRPFSAAFRLGIIWALWHLPIILWVFPAVRSSNLALLVGGGLIWCAALVPYRILMSWVYVNTKSSLLSGIIMHAFYDGTLIALVPAILAPVQTVQFWAAMNVILWIFVAVVVAVFGAKTMARAKPGFQREAYAGGIR